MAPITLNTVNTVAPVDEERNPGGWTIIWCNIAQKEVLVDEEHNPTVSTVIWCTIA